MKKKILTVSGEASGDLHAAEVDVPHLEEEEVISKKLSQPGRDRGFCFFIVDQPARLLNRLHRLPLPLDPLHPDRKPTHADTDEQDEDQECPETELIPAAFGFGEVVHGHAVNIYALKICPLV